MRTNTHTHNGGSFAPQYLAIQFATGLTRTKARVYTIYLVDSGAVFQKSPREVSLKALRNLFADLVLP